MRKISFARFFVLMVILLPALLIGPACGGAPGLVFASDSMPSGSFDDAASAGDLSMGSASAKDSSASAEPVESDSPETSAAGVPAKAGLAASSGKEMPWLMLLLDDGPSASIYTLNVSKSGTGAGTVTGTGINCGTDCSESFSSKKTVTLTATAASGSMFAGWSGCDSTSGSTCTVSVDRNRSVAAAFNKIVLQSISISGPTQVNESSGAQYTCTARYSNGSSSVVTTSASWSEGSAYAAINNTGYLTAYNVDQDQVCTITAGFGGKTATYNVTIKNVAPTTATLRIKSNSHYDMVDLRINGAQQLAKPYVILPGGHWDFTFQSSGSVEYYLAVGTYNDDGSRSLMWEMSGTAYVTLGNTTTVTFEDPSLTTLLSHWKDSAQWEGIYWTYNPTTPHSALFVITNTGRWYLYDDGRYVGTGVVALTSWPNYSWTIKFSIDSEEAMLVYPFSKFYLSNGPASWRQIEYFLKLTP